MRSNNCFVTSNFSSFAVNAAIRWFNVLISSKSFAASCSAPTLAPVAFWGVDNETAGSIERLTQLPFCSALQFFWCAHLSTPVLGSVRFAVPPWHHRRSPSTFLMRIQLTHP
eukprot:m.247747 g.247747  ORF g.247747 m.247747 type:complete len:112 (+) comp15864_c0_seq1:2572-2907(+)